MTEHRYRVDGTSTAPPEVVFAVLADGAGWSRWAPGVARSGYEREGVPAPHGVGAIRRFGPSRGPVSREEVVVYEPPRHFAYVALSGPLPWRDYRSEVVLGPGPGGDGTRIDWSGSFESRVPGLGAFIRRTVTGFVRGLIRESELRAASSPPTDA